MATITKDIEIDASPEVVWDALSDFGALHERLVPGFVVDAHLDEEGARVITFFNGAVAREVLVGRDDESRRLAYTVVDGPLDSSHHNASAQVVARGGGSRFVWITDVLPDHLAGPTAQLMQRGIEVIKQTLESAAVADA
jgi:carbon monoxide dehydrogenase subunit G